MSAVFTTGATKSLGLSRRTCRQHAKAKKHIPKGSLKQIYRSASKQLSPSLQDLDPVLLHKKFNATRELTGNIARILHDVLSLWFSDARKPAKVPGFFDGPTDISRLQERLSRNTPPVQAQPVKFFGFDNHGFIPSFAARIAPT